VVVDPSQITALLIVVVTTGKAFTVTSDTAESKETQPIASVPVTEYEVFVTGVTIADPLENVYVLAPEGVIVKDSPAQIAPLFTVIAGAAFTVTLDTAGEEDTQPLASVPLTE
jgi:hypothetical protein